MKYDIALICECCDSDMELQSFDITSEDVYLSWDCPDCKHSHATFHNILIKSDVVCSHCNNREIKPDYEPLYGSNILGVEELSTVWTCDECLKQTSVKYEGSEKLC